MTDQSKAISNRATGSPIPRFQRYTWLAIAMHWLGAALVIAAMGIGLYMVELPVSILRLKLINWHKWIGIAIIGLTLMRLGWRLFRPPPHLSSVSRLQGRLATAAHWLLYGLLLAVPLLGWAYSSASGFPIMWLGLVSLPDWVPRNRELAETLKPWHVWLSYALASLAVLHFLAAVKHQFVDKDGLMTRMRPW